MVEGRQTASVRLPDNFNPDKHKQLLCAAAARNTGKDGWIVEAIDMEAKIAYLARHTTLTEVEAENSSKKLVRLASDVGVNDGARIDQMMKDQHPGWTMTQFSPLTGRAVLKRMNDKELRARSALAVALGVGKTPWDVQVTQESPSQYTIVVPVSYVPSKHDGKLLEVAQTAIGEEGWYVRINPKTLTGVVAEGAKPSVPLLAPTPTLPVGTKLSDKERWRLPIGVSMEIGDKKSEQVYLDLSDNVGVLLVGTAGAGKSVTINDVIAAALERDWMLAIGDVPAKEVDFTWCAKYCQPGWYGGKSKRETVAVAEQVYRLGMERKKLLEEYDVTKVNDLPASVRPAPVLFVVDEYTGLMATVKPDNALRKMRPEAWLEQASDYAATKQLEQTVTKIAAELRFVGVRLLIATQQAQSNTGVSVPLKNNLPNRLLMGVRANKTARGHAFANPEDAPHIPDRIVADKKMGLGVGIAEMSGMPQPFTIFKSYFADVSEYRDRFAKRGLVEHENYRPSRALVDELVPEPELD